MPHRIASFIAIITLLFSQFFSIGYAYADLPITPDGTTSTFVTQTASGIDQVNIAAPNSSGLSHNKFNDYNVNTSGQILNNFSGAATDVVSTQIGGLVTANPNLNSGSASIILNEVTSNNISQLLGYVEIAGGGADLIIANPNGISCAGCGFINVSRLGIVGGKSEFDSNGNLEFNLSENANTQLNIPIITISGLGLDATTTTTTDIIASAIKLISIIYGSETGDLTIKTGDGKYDYATKLITQNPSSIPIASDTPLFAIDASNFAKIQSGRIFLIATKEGLGVNMAAEILAGNKVQIDANGDVYYANITAGTEVDLKSTQKIESLSTSAKITSPTLTISSDELKNLGFLTASNLSLTANSLNNSSLIYGANYLNIASTNLSNSGTIFSPEDYAVTLTGLLTNSGLISSGNNLQLSSNNLNNFSEISAKNLSITSASSITNSNKILANEDLNISATNISNDSSGIISSLTKSLALTLANDLENLGEINAAIDLSAKSQSLTNSGSIKSNKSLAVNTDYFNNSGDIYFDHLVDGLTVKDFTNSGNITSNSALQILSVTASDSFANSGLISSSDSLNLISNALTNSGAIQSIGDANFNLSSLTNSGIIKIFGDTTLEISEEFLNQVDATFYSANNLTINTESNISNAGIISSDKEIKISSDELINFGTIYSTDNQQITTTNLANSGSFTTKHLSLTTDSLTNSGEIYGENYLSISGQNLNNSGTIFSPEDYAIILTGLLTNSGLISSANSQQLTANSLINSGEISANNLALTIVNSLNNSGKILTTNDQQLTANNLVNSGEIQSGNNSIFNLSSLSNSENSSIYSAKKLTLNLSDSLINFGEISALSDLAITGTSAITNSNKILSDSDLIISGSSLNNSASGAIASLSESLTLTLLRDLENSGEINSANDLKINANLFNNSGVIYSTKNQQLTSDNLTNSGAISATSNLAITSSEITNSNNILSGGTLQITASNLANNLDATISSLAESFTLTIGSNLQNYGELGAQENLSITSNNLTNSGDILALNELTISAVSSVNNSGNFQSTQSQYLASKNLTNSGAIKSFGSANINADTIINQSNATIFATEDAQITANNSLVNAGNILGNSKLNLVSATTNNGGEIFSEDDLTLTLNDLFTNSGSINSSNDLTLSSSSNITNSNQILSGENLKITAANLTNSSGIKSGGDLNLGLSNLTNSGNIAASNDLEIVAKNSITNSSTMQSGKDFTSNSVSFTNSPNSLILASGNLAITGASIFNQNTKPGTSLITSGLVSTGGNITLKTDSLNNNSGIIAAKSTSLSALNNTSAALSNDSGSFISTAAILLNLGNLDYRITGEVTASNIDITASNITNQGSVTASDYIKLNASGNTASGTINNGISNGNNSNIKLTAGTYINLIAKGAINNYGTLQANDDITLTSNISDVNNYNKIQSGNDLLINATVGAFNNFNSSSLLTAENNIAFNSNNLNNFGEISAANNITTNITNNLSNNSTALIWSGNDATFNVTNSLINNQADIYANRNLTIQKNSSSDATQNKTNLVQNISGNIETYNGDIVIKAATLANQRSAMKVQSYVFTSWHRGYYGHEDHYYSSYTASFSGAAGSNSNIISGGNIDLNLNTLSNNSSSILSAKNIGINASNIGNVSNLFEAYRNVNNDWWCRCGNAINNYLIAYKPTGAAYTSESYPAFIKSGGSLNITQNNANKTSSFLNGNNVAQNSSVNPASQQFATTTINKIDTYTLAETGIINIDLSRFINAINQSSSAENLSSFNLESSNAPHFISTTAIKSNASTNLGFNSTEVLDSSFSTTLEDNSRLGLHRFVPESALTKNTSNNSGLNLNSSEISDPKIIYSGLYKITFDDNPNKPLIEARSEFTDQTKFFGSAEYFTQLGLDPKQVLGELDRQSRRENNITTKQLGDSFTEQKLIFDQINSLTKDSLLLSKSNSNQEAEIKDMIASAVSEFNRLGIDAKKVATKGLSKDQANSLTKDIVTFETTILNGINVLAPKIYLSLDTRSRLLKNNKLVSDSTIFAKDDLTIDAENIVSSGSITSGNNLNLNSNNSITLTNASLSSGNKLSLNAKGDIGISNNLAKLQTITLPTFAKISPAIAFSPSVASSSSVTLSTAKQSTNQQTGSPLLSSESLAMTISSAASIPTSPTSSILSISPFATATDLKNDAATARSAAIFSAGTDIEITSGGSINIANNYSQAGGSIFMNAAKDINNSNYTVQADNNIVMNATNINNISTATTAAIAAATPTKIEAGSMVSLNAQKDSSGNGGNITNLGATIKGGELVYLTAENNITNKALIDYKINGSSVNPTFTGDAASYLTSLSSTEDLITASSANNIRSTLVSQGVIESGGNIVLVAANDINNQGSKITSAGSTILEATNGDVNITTSILRDRTFSSGGSRKKNWEKTLDVTTNLQSEITSGANLYLTSGDDILLQAGKLNAADNIKITTGDDLILANATNSRFSQSKTKEKGTFAFKNSDVGGIATTILNSEINTNSNNDSTGSLTLNVGGKALVQYNSKDWDRTSNNAPTATNLTYLKSLKDQIAETKIIFDPQAEMQKNWDELNRGLTSTGQVLIAIAAAAVAVGTGGIGTGVSGAMMTAGATAAATTATVSATNASMNNDESLSRSLDDVGKTIFKDTTSKDSFSNIALSAAAAGITKGVMQASELNSATASSSASTGQRIATNSAISAGRIGINVAAYTVANSAINGVSLTDSFKDQDAKLLVAQLLGEVGAKEIGRAAHTNKISQSEQLALHGALGCALSAGAGGGCASGAAAGVTSEYLANKAYTNGANSGQAIGIGQASGAVMALLISAAQGRDDEKMVKDTSLGNFVGGNAVVNNLTLYEPGTVSDPNKVDKEFIKAMEETFGEKVIILPEDLENTNESRVFQGKLLADAIKNYVLKPNEPINLVGHSHGGNVIKEATNSDLGGKKIDTVIFLGTPHRSDYQFAFGSVAKNAKLINLYDVNDGMQSRGGLSMDGELVTSFVKGIGSYINGSTSSEKVISGFSNIQIEQTTKHEIWDWKTGVINSYEIPFGPIQSHVNLDTASVWNQHVKPELIGDKR
jgi:filamentous hemagglutinin